MFRRASESEAQRLERLTAGQQREADRRASESEAQRLEHLTAGQQREADQIIILSIMGYCFEQCSKAY